MTILHAGGKFGDGGYKVSGGLHGVGVSCVNALSRRMEVEVKKDGKIYGIEFSKGKTVRPLYVKGECDANVLKLLTSQSVTVENCSLFGCGTYGIYGEDAAVLTVIGTEIYECTNGILNLSETSHTVLEHCNSMT